MLTKRQKQNLIKEVARHENDTGSAEVQIAILTKRIQILSEHLKKNPKDFASRRGLLMLVGKRRRFLKYLKENDVKNYERVAKKLEIEV
jgi:small subunit ribosomal protein S15